MSRGERFEDDGRTVADMSGLESTGLFNIRMSGEAWHPLFGRRSRSSQNSREHPDSSKDKRNPWEDAPFTWKERVRYMGVALLAALSIALVFLAGIALIIWLITLYATL